MHLTTQQHMGLQLHQHYIDTHMDPSCGLHKATNHILYWIGTTKTMVPKKTVRKNGVVFGQARVRTGRGGGGGAGHPPTPPRLCRRLAHSSTIAGSWTTGGLGVHDDGGRSTGSN